MLAVVALAGALAVSRPEPVTPPHLIGTPRTGQVVSVDPGTWTGNGTVWFSYQWQQCDAAGTCTEVPGENAQSFRVTAAPGSRVVAVVTASDDYASTRYPLKPVLVARAAEAAAPTIALVTPRNGARVRTPRVRVVVRVSGAAGTVTIGGGPAVAGAGGLYARTVVLKPGANRIVVAAGARKTTLTVLLAPA